MRFKKFSLLVVAAVCAVHARAQEPSPPQGEDLVVRGAFVTTRPGAKKEAKKDEAAAAATPPVATRPAPPKLAANKAGARKGSKSKGKGQGADGAGVVVAASKPGVSAASAGRSGGAVFDKAAFKPAGIGVGYTLFMRDESGGAVRVSPRREFKSGEAIRLLLESNTDGYLYIFDAENDGTPQLIFPNAKLDRGDNRLRAHVPYEIPPVKGADESLSWFVFNNTPAVERVYVVVSRQPLAGVPTGEALVRACAEAEKDCAWKPSAEQWVGLRDSNARDQIAVSQIRDEGQAQTAAEREAATRGLGLAADAPLPSVIYMIASSNASVLVTTVDLIHK